MKWEAVCIKRGEYFEIGDVYCVSERLATTTAKVMNRSTDAAEAVGFTRAEERNTCDYKLYWVVRQVSTSNEFGEVTP